MTGEAGRGQPFSEEELVNRLEEISHREDKQMDLDLLCREMFSRRN